MALEVEDGTGKSDAESYVSVEDADTYHANRGNSLWATMSTTEREQALRRATDYMVGRYRTRWLGERAVAAQALDWPRADVELYDGTEIEDDVVPLEVRNACSVLAFKAASGELNSDVTGQEVLSEKVGPIETTYSKGTRGTARYREVEAIIKPYMKNLGGGFRTVRV